jgi:hypothetical protein
MQLSTFGIYTLHVVHPNQGHDVPELKLKWKRKKYLPTYGAETLAKLAVSENGGITLRYRTSWSSCNIL